MIIMTEEQQKMVLRNQGLVGYVINRLNTKYKYEDLYDVGIIGLCKGAIKFDKSRKVKESTYLVRCIQGEILKFFRQKENKKEEISLNTLINKSSKGEDLELMDLIPDTAVNIEDSIVAMELKETILKLPVKERKIICYYYGLYDYPKLNQKDIAKIVGYSQVYISRTIQKIINNLREELN